MKQDIKDEIEIPDGVQVTVGEQLSAKGPKGEVSRRFQSSAVSVTVEQKKIILESKKATKREKTMLYTIAAHIKNMLRGVIQPHYYELKVCAAHFPITVTVQGKEFQVKNFLGENTPRRLTLRDGVTVNVTGNVVRIESTDIELAGVTASEIELLTKIRNRDRRIFQDGIFITNKDGVMMQ